MIDGHMCMHVRHSVSSGSWQTEPGCFIVEQTEIADQSLKYIPLFKFSVDLARTAVHRSMMFP